MKIRVTSTSDRIVNSLTSEVISDPCIEAVLHLIKSHLGSSYDFGLTLGVLTCGFVRILSDIKENRTVQNVTKFAVKIIKGVLEGHRKKIEFSNARQMISVVGTILNSKPSIKFGRTTKTTQNKFLTQVSSKILEGILLTIPSNLKKVEFDLHLHVDVGNQDFVELREGFVISYPDIPPEMDWKFKEGKSLRILLLNLQLTNDIMDLTEMSENEKIEKTLPSLEIEKEILRKKVHKLIEFCMAQKGTTIKVYLLRINY